MNIHLLIHNAGFMVSAVAGIGIFLFLLLNKQRSLASIMMAMTTLAAIVFIISHVIGVNTSDPEFSRDVLMFNLSAFAIGAFNVHAVLAYLGKARSRWYILALLYATGLGFIIWFIANPDLFLLPSVPKMYFPDYYNPGVLNWVRLAYLDGVCVIYILVEMLVAYYHAIEKQRKQQIKYFTLALIGGHATGFIANFLVYNIAIDPLWSNIFIVIFAGVIIYGALKYELFNIRIVAKQAFLYSIGIAIVGGLIISFDYANRTIDSLYPQFPFWITPLISAIAVVLLAGLVWRNMRQNEVLKYEFVTTITHKFRTPLTHIKWASENLSHSITSPDDLTQLGYIQSADEKLVELTSLIMNISETENSGYEYAMSRHSLSMLASEIADGFKEQFDIKRLSMKKDIEPDLYAKFDESRIKFIIQTFIENAIHYTPEGGAITVAVKQANKDIVFSVTDSGIGVAAEDANKIFMKFYRGHTARLTDTEGMGIGLYMSKGIIARHGGKIWSSSEGAGKGSAFSFSLKIS